MEICPSCKSESIYRPKIMIMKKAKCDNCEAELILKPTSSTAHTIFDLLSILLVFLVGALGNFYIGVIAGIVYIYIYSLSPKISEYETIEDYKNRIKEQQKNYTMVRKDNLKEWLPLFSIYLIIVVAIIAPLFLRLIRLF